MSEFYVTPYREALQWAGQNLPDETFKTYMMLMSHANELGVCFPGFRRLGELTLHELARINDEMKEIMRLDLARQVEPAQQDRYGRWKPALYQINPQALRIAEKNIEAATTLWNSIEQTIEQKVPVQTLNSKVSIELELNQNQQNQQNQTESSNNNNNKPEIHPEKEVPNAGQIAAWQFQREAPQRAAQSGSALRQPTKTDVPPPPPVGAPGKYREIVPVRRQLRLAHEEELAQLVYKSTLMTRAIARGLIVTYGYQSVAAGLESEFVRFADKPAGALRHLLEKQQICDETLNIDEYRQPSKRDEHYSEIEI